MKDWPKVLCPVCSANVRLEFGEEREMVIGSHASADGLCLGSQSDPSVMIYLRQMWYLHRFSPALQWWA